MSDAKPNTGENLRPGTTANTFIVKLKINTI